MYTAVLADFPKHNFNSPVKWDDKAITENDLDKDFPKLVFGQTNIDDMNMSQWGKRIVTITVGDEKTNNKVVQNSYEGINVKYLIDNFVKAKDNAGIGNDGGPLRIIFGKTNYQHTNGSNQVKFAKKIIIGEGKALNNAAEGTETTAGGKKTQIQVDESSSWKHNQGVYETYKDMPVLRVTGSQVKEPMTFTLGQVEAICNSSKRKR